MAVKAARSFIGNLYRYASLNSTSFSVYPGVHNGRCLVSVSQQYWSLQPPKKPAGAFIQFINEKHLEISQINPGANIRERARIGSQMWHNLDPEERNRRKLSALEMNQRYREKYLQFLDGLSDQDRDQFILMKKTKRIARANRKHRSELKKFGKPKLPANSYMLYIRSSRLERGQAPTLEFVKGLVERWRQMPLEEKELYQEDARAENAKYQQEMLKWEDKMREIGREDLIRKKSQEKPKKVRSVKAKKKSAAGRQAKKKKQTKPKTAEKKLTTDTSSKTGKKNMISKEVQTEE